MSHFYGQDNVVTKNPQPQKVQKLWDGNSIQERKKCIVHLCKM